jgi:WD40 repeat protein
MQNSLIFLSFFRQDFLLYSSGVPNCPEKMKRLQASYVHACLPIQGVCDIVLVYSAELEGVCVQTLRGPDAVTCLVALPDGNLASGSHHGTVRVWDVDKGLCMFTLLENNMNAVQDLATIPDNCLAVASSIKVYVFDLFKSGLHVRTLTGHEGQVKALATLTDGTLASASYDDTVRLWDAASGRCVHTLRGHETLVLVLAALPDNKVASGSADCTVRVWDTAGNCLRTFDIDNEWVCALAAWPDGRIASSGAHGGEIQLFDSTGALLAALPNSVPGQVNDLAVLLDGRLVSATVNAPCIKILDADGNLVCTPQGHCHTVTSLVVLRDGRLASGSWDKTVRIWA